MTLLDTSSNNLNFLLFKIRFSEKKTKFCGFSYLIRDFLTKYVIFKNYRYIFYTKIATQIWADWFSHFDVHWIQTDREETFIN